MTWRAPRVTNGAVNGYIIHYTTDRWSDVRDWAVEAVMGHATSTQLTGLAPDRKYFFKVSARNDKGYGPYTSVMSFVTSPKPAGASNTASNTASHQPGVSSKNPSAILCQECILLRGVMERRECLLLAPHPPDRLLLK